MSDAIWIFAASICVLATVIYRIVNEVSHVRAEDLAFWMRLFCVLMLLPFAPFVAWPQAWQFYALMAGNALLVSYADLVFIGLISKSGAGLVSRFLPFNEIMVFVVWIALNPLLFFDYLETPGRTAGITLSLLAAVYFAIRLRKCPISFPVFKTVLPVLLIHIIAFFCGRYAIDYAKGSHEYAAYVYVTAQCSIVFCCYIAIRLFPAFTRRLPCDTRITSGFFSKRTIFFGIVMALLWIGGVIPKWYAIPMVENPAYVTMFYLSVPVWILLYDRLKGKREEADLLSGFGIVASVAALVVFTQF